MTVQFLDRLEILCDEAEHSQNTELGLRMLELISIRERDMEWRLGCAGIRDNKPIFRCRMHNRKADAIFRGKSNRRHRAVVSAVRKYIAGVDNAKKENESKKESGVPSVKP